MGYKMSEVLVDIQDLAKHFVIDTNFLGQPTQVLKAVDGVSLKINQGEAFGLVGESGCGKTTLGKILVNLYNPTKGKIDFDGKELTVLMKASRCSCTDILMIFQDPSLFKP
jgi:peptide/nickel transport system ATP-binding protein